MDNIPLCSAYIKKFNAAEANYGLNYINHTTWLTLETRGQRIGWFEVILPIICVLGLIGNLLNIIVLTRQRLLSRMDRLEKSATYGLTALAFSDMMFCVAVFPHCFIQHHENTSYPGDAYKLYYRLYGVGVINTLLMTSTWLVVYMAVSRFIVVVYPFHARRFLATSRGIAIIILIYIISAALTLPFILHLQVQPCVAYISNNGAIKDDEAYDYDYTSSLDTNDNTTPSKAAMLGNHAILLYEFRTCLPRTLTKCLRFYINWLWPVVADYIPLFILLTLNIRLIKELQLAENRRRISCRGQSVRNGAGQTLTLTLVIIVLMLFLLVTPSEVLRYMNPYKLWGKKAYVIVSITNVLQTLNFAFNFVLYCVVSASFRKTVKSIFRCCLPSKSARYKEALATEATLHCEITRRQGVSLSEGACLDSRGCPPMTDTNVDDELYLTYG